MSKTVQQVALMSGVSEKTVRRYIHNNDLNKQLKTTKQGGYIIPDDLAEAIKERYNNNKLAKDQLTNHRASQLKNARKLISETLNERDLKGRNAKTEKQLLWLTMMAFDKIDDIYREVSTFDSSLDSIDSNTNWLDNDLDDVNSNLNNIQNTLEKILELQSHKDIKTKVITCYSDPSKLEQKVNNWLESNEIIPKNIQFQSTTETTDDGSNKLESIHTAFITY
ncbi:helix-turn-helix domain-containing protein [Limosilactobacillus reuteri]|uniref:helix-turn-helix domain-containing protein n=1 Tax=Limosilactobacillus reuteri TaxID=1598 RepID=UPI001E3A71A2|nr:helix-turn-helix domain-containing protein [Limosilactobacillus reuteri]MCC4361946.1 helix-turn-helix domain-containing protein [Limosilactobacillus reuteri]MCC4363770.1 helix-turn-helix domain-containing protein [Limosilactobacillus reuteri]